MGDEQASCLQKCLQPFTTIVPIVSLQKVEERTPAMRESLNCMQILKSEPGPCIGLCQLSSDDGNQFAGIKDEPDAVMKVEEDPGLAAPTGIKTEPASCLDVLRCEQESCAETCSVSPGDGKQFGFVNIDDDTVIKKEEDPEPAASTAINNGLLNCLYMLRNDPGPYTGTCQLSSDGVNQFVGNKDEGVAYTKVEEDPWPATCMGINTEPASCLDVLRGEQQSCAETCSVSSSDGKQLVFVNVDDDTVIKWQEDPEPMTSTAINNDPLSAVSGQLCTCGGKGAASCNACNEAFVDRTDLETHKQNCVNLLRSDTGLCSETCLMSLDDEKWGVGIKVEEDSDREEELNPQPEACQTIKAEPESAVNGQLCTCGGKGAASCNACNEAFVDRTDLETHKQIHIGERLFSCKVCQKAFIQWSDLMQHKKLHSRERPFLCDVCGSAFAWKKSLIQHMQMHSANQPFSCDVCNKGFVCQSELLKHKRVHSQERPFSCDVCNNKFIQKAHLLTHKRIHIGQRPFSCEVCHKAFIQWSNLMQHKKLHSGERPFVCDVCDRAFVWKKSLMQHMRMHSANQPFSCDVCNKGFVCQSKLLTHKRIHSRETPFSCDVCNKKFIQKAHLLTHKLIHIGEQPF